MRCWTCLGPEYYAWKNRPPSNRDNSDAELTALIVEIHKEHKGRLGINRLVSELAKRGHQHSSKRVRRLARAAGLTCVHPKPYKTTTIRDDAAGNDGLVDLVDRDFVPDGPDQLWFTDITYYSHLDRLGVPGHDPGRVSGKVVGWAIDSHMRTELVLDALRMAIDRRRPPIGQAIIHSDRGSQYCAASTISNGTTRVSSPK